MLTEVILMCISKVNWWMPIKVILVYFKSDLLHTNRSDPNVYKCDLSLSLSLSLLHLKIKLYNVWYGVDFCEVLRTTFGKCLKTQRMHSHSWREVSFSNVDVALRCIPPYGNDKIHCRRDFEYHEGATRKRGAVSL